MKAKPIINLNAIVFGNLSKPYKKMLDIVTPMSKLFERYKGKKPNANGSKETYEEIQELVRLQKQKFTRKELSFFHLVDTDMKKAMFMYCEQKGIYFDEKRYDEIRKDVDVLCMKLKNHFQRPRPSQLSHYLEVPLHPLKSKACGTPSYPSSHALMSYLVCSTMGYNDLDNNGEKLMVFARMVCDSRMQMGVHYRSDVEYGVQIAKDIIKTTYFKKKYLISDGK